MSDVSILHKQYRSLVIGLSLSLLPVLVLIFTLAKSGHWKDALGAFWGKYTVAGVPSNPWLEFLPLFCLSLLVFVGSSWLASAIAESPQSTWLKLVVIIPLILLASAAFGGSMVYASVVNLWFQDSPVIGLPTSSILFWLSSLLSVALLIASCLRRMLANGIEV